MNIFILSEQINPHLHYKQQAEFHCDKHVIKMIAESTQLLVTALSSATYPELGTYLPASIVDYLPCKPLGATHSKHPCAVWITDSVTNFNYVASLAVHLCMEHQYRYPLSPEHAYATWLWRLHNHLESIGLGFNHKLPSHFAVAIKSASKQATNVDHLTALDLYRNYYVADKARFATWKKRQKPVWFMLLEEALETSIKEL